MKSLTSYKYWSKTNNQPPISFQDSVFLDSHESKELRKQKKQKFLSNYLHNIQKLNKSMNFRKLQSSLRNAQKDVKLGNIRELNFGRKFKKSKKRSKY